MQPAEELAVIGSLKETVKVLGRTFVLNTLDADAEVMASNNASAFDLVTRERVIKIEKLARAIKAIDGAPFSVSEEEKAAGLSELQKARKLLYKWQPVVVNRVYDELLKLEKKRDDAIIEIEKNAQTPTTSTGSSK